MRLLRTALVYGDPSGDGPTRLARFLAEKAEEFSPVLVGNERIYTAALSKNCPALIDRFPVYDVPVGKILLGEPNEASGRAFLDAAKKLPYLARHGLIDAALVIGCNEQAVQRADRRVTDDLALWEHIFPARKPRREIFLVNHSAVYLYRGLPLPLVMSEDAKAAWAVLRNETITIIQS